MRATCLRCSAVGFADASYVVVAACRRGRVAASVCESATSPPKLQSNALQIDQKGGNSRPLRHDRFIASVQTLLAMSTLRREAWTGEPYEETLHMHPNLPGAHQWPHAAGIRSATGVPEAVVYGLRHRQFTLARALRIETRSAS